MKRHQIYAWCFASERGIYKTTLLNNELKEALVTCDCPMWLFPRKGGERRCKHTRLVAGEVAVILAMGQPPFSILSGEPMQQIARCPAMPPLDSPLQQCELGKYHDGLHLSDGDSFDSEKFPADMVTQCRYCTPTDWGTHNNDCPRFGKGEVNQMPKAIKDTSSEVKAAAEALLAAPTALGMLNEEMKKVGIQLSKIVGTLEGLVSVVLERRSLETGTPPPAILTKKQEPKVNAPKPKVSVSKPEAKKPAGKATKASRSAAAFAAAETRRRRALAATRRG